MTEIEEKHKIVKLKDLNANLGPDADLVTNHPHHNNNISGLKGPFLLQGSNISESDKHEHGYYVPETKEALQEAIEAGAKVNHPFKLVTSLITDMEDLLNPDRNYGHHKRHHRGHKNQGDELWEHLNGCSEEKIGDITFWDVEHVTNMTRLFKAAYNFNQNISAWDVKNVKQLQGTFFLANKFKQPHIKYWDVRNCTDFLNIFKRCPKMDNVKGARKNNVTNKYEEFHAVDNGIHLHDGKKEWFHDHINDPMPEPADGEAMTVEVAKEHTKKMVVKHGNTISIVKHFFDKIKEHLPASNTGHGKIVIADRERFHETPENEVDEEILVVETKEELIDEIEKPSGLRIIISEELEDLSNLFDSGHDSDFWDITQNDKSHRTIDHWEVGHVTNMEGMFKDTKFNQDISEWNVEKVTSMKSMFENNDEFNQNIVTWDVNNVGDFEDMFDDATAFDQDDLQYWHVKNGSEINNMFFGTKIANSTNEQNLQMTDGNPQTATGSWFLGPIFRLEGKETICSAPLDHLKGSNIELEVNGVKEKYYVPVDLNELREDISEIYFFDKKEKEDDLLIEAVKNSAEQTAQSEGKTEAEVTLAGEQAAETAEANLNNDSSNDKQKVVEEYNNIITTHVDSFQNVLPPISHPEVRQNFNGEVNKWDTRKVTSMVGVFRSAMVFNQPIGDWDTSNVINMTSMFYSDFHQNTKFNQDISGWDVRKVVDFASMFAKSDFNQPLTNWQTDSAIKLDGMFGSCEFNQPLEHFNTSNVVTMINMFGGNKVFNQPLDKWDTSKVENFEGMFRESVMNYDISTWSMESVTNVVQMFDNAEFNHASIQRWSFNKNILKGISPIPGMTFGEPSNNNNGIFYNSKFMKSQIPGANGVIPNANARDRDGEDEDPNTSDDNRGRSWFYLPINETPNISH